MPLDKIVAGNSDTILPTLLNRGEKFDLILTDPPYNLRKDFGNDSDSLSIPDFIDISRERINLCANLLTPEGSLVWFGIHHFIGHLQVLMYESGLHYRRMNIWRYQNGFSRSKRVPKGEYEPFLWFSKSNSIWTYNTDDVRVPYKSSERLKTPVWYTDSKGERKQWKPDPRGAMRGDVWEFPTLAGKRFAQERTKHPTQKPESLMRELVKAFCPKNPDGRYCGTVLDPFVGSGTTAVVCEQLNQEGHDIRYLGIEMEERWAQIAITRIEATRNQPKIF